MANVNTPQTIKHENRSKNRDYNVYVEEYFGGSDAFIYVDGKRDHNIAAISFQISEQHKPIYGYGSRTFDDLAVGSRIVSGAIRIPIRNKADSDFGKEWGKLPQGNLELETVAFSARTIVPDWVYNYTPEKEDNTIVIENEDEETLSVVALVQEELGLEANGFIDEATRKAVTQYRIDNGMMLGTLIDNELLSDMGVEDYSCYTNRRIHLYNSPTKDSSISILEKDTRLTFIASDDEMALVRSSENGMAGYVFMGDVHRK